MPSLDEKKRYLIFKDCLPQSKQEFHTSSKHGASVYSYRCSYDSYDIHMGISNYTNSFRATNFVWVSSWWIQPIWKICPSNWESSPNRDENKKYLSCHHLGFFPATATLSEMPEAKWNQVPPEGEKKWPNWVVGGLFFKYLMGLEDGKKLEVLKMLVIWWYFFFLTRCSFVICVQFVFDCTAARNSDSHDKNKEQ